MILRTTVFLLLNFGALAIGGLFTSKGVPSDWYLNLEKAPWTPPGWMFGSAWTLIMICFSLYMAYLWPESQNKVFLVILFAVQWVLNVSWNPVFFYWQEAGLGLIIISGLTVLICVMLVLFLKEMEWRSFMILPYAIWLVIATSLNAYILIKN